MKPIVLLLTVMALLGAVAGAQDSPADPTAAAKTVYVLPVHGPIDQSMLFVFRRAFTEAELTNPSAIIIDLDTPGGRLKETEEIISWIRSQRARIPVYAYVNPDALSAGAMISLGTTAIFMAPVSKIGSAMPILVSPFGGVQELPADYKEKIFSDVRAMVRSLAQENGYNEDVAEAMVDPNKVVVVGDHVVCKEGQLLNLTANEAVEVIPPTESPLLAKGIAKDIPDLLAQVGLGNARTIRFETTAAERFAAWITMIGPLFLALGLVGIYIEIRTPGFGLPGILGGMCLGIYFFGHYVAGLAGYIDIILILVGIVLLALEVFVIPGFGVAGISGILCILGGAFLSVVPSLPNAPPLDGVDAAGFGDYIGEAMGRLGVTIILIAILAWIASKILPKTPFYSALVLDAGLAREDGYVSSDIKHSQSFLNQIGVARTMLRPAGTAEFGTERVDVVTSGDLVPKGSRIRVVRVEGSRVVVERVEDGEA
jgi:membrane-bound serine protease (ClpP class)